MTDDDTPDTCAKPCWHGSAHCELPPDHPGDHEAHAARWPGAKAKHTLLCTWSNR